MWSMSSTVIDARGSPAGHEGCRPASASVMTPLSTAMPTATDRTLFATENDGITDDSPKPSA